MIRAFSFGFRRPAVRAPGRLAASNAFIVLSSMIFATMILAVVPCCGSLRAAPSERAEGKLLFDRDCAGCHQIGPGAVSVSTGPALNGIVGMPAAAEPGFSYSDANRKCGVIWTATSFDAFIADPQADMPGTTMAFPGLKGAADRKALFAYISQFAETPAPATP